MKIISFSWTSPALVLGVKTVTRREWAPDYAARFRSGEQCQAWSKSPYAKGAERIGTVELIRDPYRERTSQMPGEDYESEGFGVLWGADGPANWQAWKDEDGDVFVVRFRLVELTEAGKRLRDDWRARLRGIAELLELPNLEPDDQRLRRLEMVRRALAKGGA